jgi:hypothetical protein
MSGICALIIGASISTKDQPQRFFHALEDCHGNPAPKDIPSCWQQSNEGRLTMDEYFASA